VCLLDVAGILWLRDVATVMAVLVLVGVRPSVSVVTQAERYA